MKIKNKTQNVAEIKTQLKQDIFIIDFNDSEVQTIKSLKEICKKLHMSYEDTDYLLWLKTQKKLNQLDKKLLEQFELDAKENNISLDYLDTLNNLYIEIIDKCSRKYEELYDNDYDEFFSNRIIEDADLENKQYIYKDVIYDNYGNRYEYNNETQEYDLVDY